MKTKFQLGLVVLSLGVVIQGCNLKPESIRFAPQLEVRQNDIGQGEILGLEVADTRPDKQLGIVGDPKIKSINVTAEDASPSAIYKEAADALTKLGFKVEPATDASERAGMRLARAFAAWGDAGGYDAALPPFPCHWAKCSRWALV